MLYLIRWRPLVPDPFLYPKVARSRHMYGPGAEYAAFAGRDATLLLAKVGSPYPPPPTPTPPTPTPTSPTPPTPPTSRPARSTRSCLSSRCAARVCCACRRCQTSSTRWGVRSSRGRHWRCATGRVSGAAQCQSHRPRRGMCTMTCFGIWSRTRISIAGGGIRRGRSHSGLERGERERVERGTGRHCFPLSCVYTCFDL